MNIFLLAILFLFAPFYIFADQNQTQNGSIRPPPPAQSSSPVKNGTAAGRYGGGGGGYGYSAQQYSGEYELAYEHSQRLIDDYVCDLDASILVVTNSDRKYQKESAYGNGQQREYGQKEEYGGGKSGYAAGRTEGKRGKRGAPNYGGRGYGERRREYGQQNDGYGSGYGQKDYGHTNEYSVAKAHRLRCSAIAVNSDEDCKKCCHMAARKERSLSKESIVGFIVDYDEIRQPSKGYEPTPYRMKRNADEPIYPPSAKPEDYQYNAGEDQQNYGKQQSSEGYSQNAGTGGEGNYGQGGGYGKKQESSSGNDYQPSNYGNTYSYNYPQRPKNARCVCCAPKANVLSSNGEYKSGYGKVDGDEYGGGKQENYEEYGQEENNNGYGGDEHESEESGEVEYGPRGPPPKQNYGMENEYEYGRGNDRREGGYGNDGGRRQYYDGHGGGGYGGNGKKGRKYGRNKGGPY